VSLSAQAYLTFIAVIFKTLLGYFGFYWVSRAFFALTLERGHLQGFFLSEEELDDILTVSSAIVQAFFVLRAALKIRRRIQLSYLLAKGGAPQNGKNGVDFNEMASKSLLVTGMEHLDMSGDGLRHLLKFQTGHSLEEFGVTAFVILPGLKRQFSLSRHQSELTLLREVHSNTPLNWISRLLLPQTVTSEAIFHQKMQKMTKKIEVSFQEALKPSGYAFLCFREAESASKFKLILKEFPKQPQWTRPLPPRSGRHRVEVARPFPQRQLAKLFPQAEESDGLHFLFAAVSDCHPGFHHHAHRPPPMGQGQSDPRPRWAHRPNRR